MSGSFYQLNQKYNQLLALIQGLPTTHDLTEVLTAGDDAGGLDITNLNNINLTTINGAAYPPPAVIPTLGGVLGSGNDGLGQSITNINDVALTTINGAAYPPPAPVNVFNNVVYFGTATITTPNKVYYLDGAGGWVLADYTNSAGKLIAIAVGTDSSVDGMYISSNTGNLPVSVPSAAIGDAIFLSSVAGEIDIQPAGTNLSIARQVGYKISATEIKFFLYPIYIEAMGSNGYGIATEIGGTTSTITDVFSYTLLDFYSGAGTKTFTVSVAGLFDVLMVGGGGGGGNGVGYSGEGGGGGGAGQMLEETLYLPVGTYDVVVGAGGVSALGLSYAGNTGFNIQPLASAGRLRYEALGGVVGGQSWGGATKGYNAGGASYRSGYGGNAGTTAFSLYGTASGASNGSGNNGGGGGYSSAGTTRTTNAPAVRTGTGGGGSGIVSTFLGVATTFCEGGCAGGNSGSVPTMVGAGNGTGGGGAIGATNGQTGADGKFAVRFRN